MSEQENSNDLQAREVLETTLTPGERLQAYTSGSMTVEFFSKTYHLGLTMDRLILLPHKRGRQSGRVISIQRENIESLKWSGFGGSLRIKFGMDECQISISKRHWRRRAKSLVDLHNQLPQPNILLERDEKKSRIIQQAEAFHDLGFLRSAIAEIEKLQPDPENAVDPEVQRINQQFADERLAVRVGAGFLFINIGISVVLMGLFALCSLSESLATILLLIPAVIDIMIGINLWKGTSRQWQSWAVLRAVLSIPFYGFIFLSQGQILDFVIQTSLCASILIVLTGDSNRNRTWLAVGVFGIGFLGLVVLSLIAGFIHGFLQG